MEIKVERVEAGGGSVAEVAVVTVGGKEHVALGSCVDLENGIIHGYVGPLVGHDASGVSYLPGRAFRLSTFSGEHIGVLVLRSTSRWIQTAHGRHRFVHYTMRYAGHSWHGKNSGEHDLIRLRRGKPLAPVVRMRLRKPGPEDMLGLPSLVKK